MVKSAEIRLYIEYDADESNESALNDALYLVANPNMTSVSNNTSLTFVRYRVADHCVDFGEPKITK